MERGKKNWVFCDGYLPPKGDNPEFEGHEALMLTNLNDEKAKNNKIRRNKTYISGKCKR